MSPVVQSPSEHIQVRHRLVYKWRNLIFTRRDHPGDPLAMGMYAIATVPLIKRISNDDVKQSWYTDDTAAGGILSGLRSGGMTLQKSAQTMGTFQCQENPPFG